ncbi:MAG: MarR family transcriptional regulator [Gammaproteobacteria bacterium]|jgi:DNA-binding MarR family transcriptional regulator|nr:MarR family transcriptional regulator [Gammaproteobacteria bacterium]
MNSGQDAYKVTWLVRRLFRAMAESADTYLGDTGLTAADRAVMEFLYPDTELTVPDIARRYQVSRQHVQVTVNRLLDKELVINVENPRHKRSSLLRLTQNGRERFAAIRRHEGALLDEIFAGLNPAEVAATRRTLETLLGHFQETHHD